MQIPFWETFKSLEYFFSQFCVQIKVSTVLGVKELLNGSRMHPPVLNADSEATVDTGMARTSLATSDKNSNLDLLIFHQCKMLEKIK